MWTCPKCGEKHEDKFDSCWKCYHQREVALTTSVDSGNEETPPQIAKPEVRCVRCALTLKYLGTKRFHEGTRLGVLGPEFELLENTESFDVFVCPRCGRAEFFIGGIGDELRQVARSVRDEGGSGLLDRAATLQTQGKFALALVLYSEAVAKFPGSASAADALRSIEEIRKKLEDGQNL